MNVAFVLLWLLATACLVAALIKPKLFTRIFQRTLSRLKLGLIFGTLFMGLGMAVGATAPPAPPVTKPATLHTSAPKPKAGANHTAAKQTHRSKAVPAKPKPQELRGIGETDTVWNATHKADGQFRKGAAYDLMPNSNYGDASNPKNTDKYVAVVHENGVISDYNVQLKHGVSQSKAQSIVMAEMPTDATILRRAINSNGCYLISLHSNLLASDLAKNNSQNKGGIVIELDTVSSDSLDYNANNVNFMNIRLANYPGDTSAPDCRG